MSDEREDPAEPRDEGEKGRSGSDAEPLGDLAAEVRERSTAGPGAERPARSRREGPLSDVAADVDERRRRREAGSDAFESVEVGELDGERLWTELVEGEDSPVTVPQGEPAGAEWDDIRRDVRTIPKETCHGCPHLGAPPELACTHEGTDILAMVDSERFRVADCPIVAREEGVDSFGVESEDGEQTAE